MSATLTTDPHQGQGPAGCKSWWKEKEVKRLATPDTYHWTTAGQMSLTAELCLYAGVWQCRWLCAICLLLMCAHVAVYNRLGTYVLILCMVICKKIEWNAPKWTRISMISFLKQSAAMLLVAFSSCSLKIHSFNLRLCWIFLENDNVWGHHA